MQGVVNLKSRHEEREIIRSCVVTVFLSHDFRNSVAQTHETTRRETLAFMSNSADYNGTNCASADCRRYASAGIFLNRAIG